MLMEIVADLGAAPFVPDVILASGNTVYAHDVVAALFASHGLKAENHIVEDHHHLVAGIRRISGADRPVGAFGAAAIQNGIRRYQCVD